MVRVHKPRPRAGSRPELTSSHKVDLIVEPGDEVRTHCVYDSSERTAVTIGGPGTENEMCWNLVTYWPRVPQPIDLCGSG